LTDQPGTYDGALDGPDVVDAEIIDPGTGLAVPEGRDVAVPEYGLDPWSEPEIVAEAYDLPPVLSSRGTSAPGRQVTGDAPAAASGGGSRAGGRGGGGSGGGRPRKGRGSRAGRGGGFTLLGLHIHLPSISLLSDNAVIKVGKGSASSRTGKGRSSRKTSSSRSSGTSRRTSGLRVPQRRPIHQRGMLDRLLGGGR